MQEEGGYRGLESPTRRLSVAAFINYPSISLSEANLEV